MAAFQEEVRMHKFLPCPLALLCAAALAQGALPTEFPAASRPVAAASLKESLAGKTFNVDLADGTRWRLEYWRADDSRLCTRLRGAEMSCNEVRDAGGLLYLKRGSGEVIALQPR
jgi:hypothetical protein